MTYYCLKCHRRTEIDEYPECWSCGNARAESFKPLIEVIQQVEDSD